MKNKELQQQLSQFSPDAEIWMPVFNGYVETYGLVDHMIEAEYAQISNDFFGTPGRMDKRLFENHRGPEHDEDKVICLSSMFGRFPNKKVDFGSDNINYPIKTINGEGGDPHLVWNINDFERHDTDGELYFIRMFRCPDKIHVGFVQYYPDRDELSINNEQYGITFTGKFTGIEDIRNILEACKVPFNLIC